MDKASYEEANPQLTRPDTGLPWSREGGQGPYFWLGEPLGRSGMPKNPINVEKGASGQEWHNRKIIRGKNGEMVLLFYNCVFF